MNAHQYGLKLLPQRTYPCSASQNFTPSDKFLTSLFRTLSAHLTSQLNNQVSYPLHHHSSYPLILTLYIFTDGDLVSLIVSIGHVFFQSVDDLTSYFVVYDMIAVLVKDRMFHFTQTP